MKIIKVLSFLLIGLLCCFSAYVSITESTFNFEESKIIEAPNELLFNTVNNYKTWQHWDSWMKTYLKDLTIKYGNTSSGQDASFRWEDNNQKEGEIKTVTTAPFSSINQMITYTHLLGSSSYTLSWKFKKMEDSKNKCTMSN